jgi:hypothetical protein
MVTSKKKRNEYVGWSAYISPNITGTNYTCKCRLNTVLLQEMTWKVLGMIGMIIRIYERFILVLTLLGEL